MGEKRMAEYCQLLTVGDGYEGFFISTLFTLYMCEVFHTKTFFKIIVRTSRIDLKHVTVDWGCLLKTVYQYEDAMLPILT